MTANKILIADDNLTNVELLEAYLSDMDCEIAVAADGRETLDKVAEFQPGPDPAGHHDAQAQRLRGLQDAQEATRPPARS